MGAGQTKQKSVLQQVNDIVNYTVNKSSTSIQVRAQANQNINIQCTPEQLQLASIANAKLRESYTLALKYYYENGGKGQPPKEPIEVCSARDITQKATIALKSDAQSKESMANGITTELKSKATQVDDLMKTTSIVGYSETDKTTIAQIITNVKNSTLNETVLDIVNSAIVDQNITGSGVGYSNIRQESAVSLIAGAIVDNITNNINKSDLELENTQDSKQEEKSGQVEGVKAVTSMISNVVKTVGDAVTSLAGMWIFVVLVIVGVFVGLIYKFPGVFCKFPGLGTAIKLAGLCSENNTQVYQQQKQAYISPNMGNQPYKFINLHQFSNQPHQFSNQPQQPSNPYPGFQLQQPSNPHQFSNQPQQPGFQQQQPGFQQQQFRNPHQFSNQPQQPSNPYPGFQLQQPSNQPQPFSNQQPGFQP
jgi:hypothetical protein